MSWPTGYEAEMNYADRRVPRRSSSGVVPARDPTGKLRAAHDQVAANFAALDFLERSRDVANEVVAEGARAETSPSTTEENRDSDSGLDV
jgi:hypothetical protein